MPEQKHDPKEGAANAADNSTEADTSNRQSGHTGAGQEASRGKAPEQHDTEHQSEYGGGGANGGTKGS